MDKYREALAEYVSVLAKSSVETKFMEDQSLYQLHLAQSALMFLAVEKDGSIDKLRQIAGMVSHVYRLNPLHGESGTAAKRAFETFANSIEMA